MRRKAGVRNRITADIKKAIVTACQMLGDFMRPEAKLPKGTTGLIGYMVMLGRDHPTTMAMLLCAVMPLTLTAKVEHLPDYPTEEEVRAKLAALGMPWQSIHQLEHQRCADRRSLPLTPHPCRNYLSIDSETAPK
jgi:hypothetical protein